MATWKVKISGTQRPVLDPDQLLGAVLALGRQLAEEKRQEQLRQAAKAQRTDKPNRPSTTERTSSGSEPEVR